MAHGRNIDQDLSDNLTNLVGAFAAQGAGDYQRALEYDSRLLLA